MYSYVEIYIRVKREIMKQVILFIIIASSTFIQAQRQSIIDRSETTIKRSFRNNGGSVATMKAIEKSLQWFQNKQNPDGSWGKIVNATMTAFVLKVYLANGKLPDSKDYGETVKKAIDFLSKQEISNSMFSGYSLAIHTIAISEAYGMTGDPTLQKSMNKCIRTIIDGQQEFGCYDYRFNKDSERQDLSISSWSFNALKTAKEAGCTEKGLDKAIELATNFLIKHTSGKNEFIYSTRNNAPKEAKAKHTMRAAGTASLQSFGQGAHKELKDDLKTIYTNDFKNLDWKTPPACSLYGWYFATQAMFHSGSSKWRSWYSKLQKVFVENQNNDGSWIYPGKSYTSSFKDNDSKIIYSTALGSLTLSTSYRFPKDRANAVYNIPVSKK